MYKRQAKDDKEYERFLEMRVVEVSPVLQGAGVDTQTLDIRTTDNTADGSPTFYRRGLLSIKEFEEPMEVSIQELGMLSHDQLIEKGLEQGLTLVEEFKVIPRSARERMAYLETRLMLAGIEVPDETN